MALNIPESTIQIGFNKMEAKVLRDLAEAIYLAALTDGVVNIDDLGDVNVVAPSRDELLQFDGTEWYNERKWSNFLYTTATSYTLRSDLNQVTNGQPTAGYHGEWIGFTSSSPVTVTMNPDTDMYWGTTEDGAYISYGGEWTIVQLGTGRVAITSTGGVVLNVPPGKSLYTMGQGAVVKFKRKGLNEWMVYGDLLPLGNESIIIACSDETTALTTGTAKVTLRMPYAFTLTAVRASVTTAPTGSTLVVDINENGSSILSTKLSIDASEKTSTTAATPAVISDTSLADDAEITIDIDQIGSTIAGAGLKVYLIGYKTP